MLAEGFTLKGKAYDIDFAAADDEIREIDVREQDGGCLLYTSTVDLVDADVAVFCRLLGGQCHFQMHRHRSDSSENDADHQRGGRIQQYRH